MSFLMQRVHDACRVEGVRPPNRRTIERRVDELQPRLAARRRGEGDTLAAATSSPGAYVANRPNEVWQIDHTLVDVIVVDEQLRRPIGRPVLTIAIDICTRMVAGFYLSLDPPSSASVGLCLLHAAYEKTAWLAERDIDLSWPVAGLPSILHCDNGAEFHSHVVDAREATAGDTQLARRLDQVALPRWKADEEFQALVSAVLRSLPLRRPSALSSQSLRHLARVSEGITAKLFATLNELAIEAIRTCSERITDEAIEAWKPAVEKEAAFA